MLMHFPENWKSVQFMEFFCFIYFVFQKIKTKSNYNANSPYSVPKSVNRTPKKGKMDNFLWMENEQNILYELFLNFVFTLLEAM